MSMSKPNRLCRAFLAGIGVTAALALTACGVTQPGSYMEAETRANPSVVQYDLYFQPGSPAFASGEAGKITQGLQSLVLNSEDDILVYMSSTGIPVLDTQRQRAVASLMSPAPARVRIVRRPGFPLAAVTRRDAALVEVRSYSQVRVHCPNQNNDFIDDLYQRNVLRIGCTNSANIANMAVDMRDLTDPGHLQGSESGASAAAVNRYRADSIKEPLPVRVEN